MPKHCMGLSLPLLLHNKMFRNIRNTAFGFFCTLLKGKANERYWKAKHQYSEVMFPAFFLTCCVIVGKIAQPPTCLNNPQIKAMELDLSKTSKTKQSMYNVVK